LQVLPVLNTLVASYYNSRLENISQINRPGPLLIIKTTRLSSS